MKVLGDLLMRSATPTPCRGSSSRVLSTRSRACPSSAPPAALPWPRMIAQFWILDIECSISHRSSQPPYRRCSLSLFHRRSGDQEEIGLIILEFAKQGLSGFASGTSHSQRARVFGEDVRVVDAAEAARRLVELKLKSKPAGKPVSFREVITCARCTEMIRSTAFTSTIKPSVDEQVQLEIVPASFAAIDDRHPPRLALRRSVPLATSSMTRVST